MSPSSNYPSQTSSSASSQPTPPCEKPVELPQDEPVNPNPPEESSPSDQIQTVVELSETAVSESSESASVPTVSASAAEPETDSQNQPDEPDTRLLQHPIPPPSEPRQYRAIGLVRGRYQASDEQFTQGTLYTPNGIEIDAVLLGRVMSLVKKHIDLNEEHLWVVYPRTRQEEENLHVQIVGVWEPETLKSAETSDQTETDAEEDLVEAQLPSDSESDSEEEESATKLPSDLALAEIEHGYFSVRGEVVYQSQEHEKYIIIKIRQSSRKDSDKPKFFKLKLNGLAGLRAVGHFWDLHVRLDDNALKIEESHDIGSIPVKRWKKPFDHNPRFSPRGRGNSSGGGYRDRRDYQPRSDSARPAESSTPKPKPKIQKNRSESS